MENVDTEKMLNWYNNIPLGEERDPIELVITTESNDTWLGYLDDATPWYGKDVPFGGPIVHPSYLGPQIRRAFGSPSKGRYSPEGQALVQEEHEYYAPVMLDTPLKLTSKPVDKYVKRGRYYHVTECLIQDEDGKDLVRITYHTIITGLRDDQ